MQRDDGGNNESIFCATSCTLKPDSGGLAGAGRLQEARALFKKIEDSPVPDPPDSLGNRLQAKYRTEMLDRFDEGLDSCPGWSGSGSVVSRGARCGDPQEIIIVAAKMMAEGRG